MIEISRKILCVDDDERVLDGLRRQLRRSFALTTAAGGEAGLVILREQGPFAVVVSDYMMPEMNGVEFLRQARAMFPETVLVMLTGQADLNVAVAALHEGQIFRFLNKPCTPEVLEATLRDCIEQYRLVVTEQLLKQELDQANEELRLLNENLERLVRRRTVTLEGLYRLVSDLNGLDSLGDVAQAIVSRASEMLASRRVILFLPEAGGDHLAVKAAVGLSEAHRTRTRVAVGAPICGRVFRDCHGLVINGQDELADYPHRQEPDELLGLPLAAAALITPDGPVGVLMAAEPVNEPLYDPDSLANLRAIAEAAAIALLNQLRREERDDARDSVILALAKLAEHRDPDTGAHLERVQGYCRLLSEALSRDPRFSGMVTPTFIHNIVRSSPLHDIGKVGIPDRLLLKPGRLTPDEFTEMKRHTQVGGDTIRALVEQGRGQTFLQMGMEIAYYHHERYDGTGYPEGLAGTQIPLAARIMSLADVYDALTSRRVYKAPYSHGKVAEFIQAESGRHFDPDVVAAFVAQEAHFERLCTALADPAPATPALAAAESKDVA